jgi:hypothetical protein
LKPIRLKKIEEFGLDMCKDPLPFSLPDVSEQVSPPTAAESTSKDNNRDANATKGADPPSYEDAMNDTSFQEKVDADLARELQTKLNTD